MVALIGSVSDLDRVDTDADADVALTKPLLKATSLIYMSSVLCFLPLASPTRHAHLPSISILVDTRDCVAVRRIYARVPALEPSIYDSCAIQSLLAFAILAAFCSRIFPISHHLLCFKFRCLDLDSCVALLGTCEREPGVPSSGFSF